MFNFKAIDPNVNSQDPQALRNALKVIRLHNDGDMWSGEKSITGLKQSLNDALPNSIVYLITDDEGNDYAKESEVLPILQKKQIKVYVLMLEKCKTFTTPGCKVYENISRLSGGLLFNMDTTGIQKVLSTQKRNIDPNIVALTNIIQEAAGVAKTNVSVDQSIQEICASVTGVNPTLSVFGQDNVKIALISELAMDRYKFGCIKDPGSG